MKKFSVTYKRNRDITIEVEAKTQDEALEKAFDIFLEGSLYDEVYFDQISKTTGDNNEKNNQKNR